MHTYAYAYSAMWHCACATHRAAAAQHTRDACLPATHFGGFGGLQVARGAGLGKLIW